jgi:hypothetical protein
MDSTDEGDGSGDRRLPPGALAERLRALEAGDGLVVNDREVVLEVVDADRYSILAVDPDGNEYTLSQNLQTGGWSVHEDLRWVRAVDPDSGGR